MPPAGFEPTIRESELHRTDALDRSATKLDDLIYIATGRENLSVVKTIIIRLINIVLIHGFVCFTVYRTLRFL
jgi:hypothetical protein